MPRIPKPQGSRRVACRYQIRKVDGSYWAVAFDQGAYRYPEADYVGEVREKVVEVVRERVNKSYHAPCAPTSEEEMATPEKRSKEMTDFIKNTFGISIDEHVEADVCIPAPMGCGGPATEFRDELSKKEYTISGFCQVCQDRIEAYEEQEEDEDSIT